MTPHQAAAQVVWAVAGDGGRPWVAGWEFLRKVRGRRLSRPSWGLRGVLVGAEPVGAARLRRGRSWWVGRQVPVAVSVAARAASGAPVRGEASPTAVGAWSPLNGAAFYHALLGLHLSRPRADAAAEASFTGVGEIAVDGAIAVLRHKTPRLSAQGVMPAAFGWVSMRWKEGDPLRWVSRSLQRRNPSAPQGATDEAPIRWVSVLCREQGDTTEIATRVSIDWSESRA